MHKLLLAGAAALAMASSAIAETRNLSGFEGVAASGRYSVEVTIGSAFAVEVTGPEASRLRTWVDDDTLKIEPRNRPWFGSEPRIDASVRVTLPRLVSLAAARGADVRAADLQAGALSLAAAMGGEVTASGTCTALSAAASMGGAVDASDLQCTSADVAASMGGDARVFASQSLDAAASMGGSVRVGGAPAHTEIATSMGGDGDIR